MTSKSGLHWWEDFSPGDEFSGGPREINERDLLFCALWCGDGQPHSNEEYSRKTPWGRRMVHGDGTLAMGAGLIYGQGIFDGSLAGYESMTIRYPNPVYIGDRVSAKLTIEAVQKRPAGEPGIVTGRLQIRNDTMDTLAVDTSIQYAVKRRS
jgi:acyl dehydratase